MSSTEIISLALGVLGLIFGIYQIYSAQSARKMYKNYCKIRCKDATDKAGRLADNIVQVCMFFNHPSFARVASQDAHTARAYAILSGHISATLDVAKDWVRFCLRLNEEHQYEFKETAISEDEINHLRTLRECMHELDEMSDIESAPEGSNKPPIKRKRSFKPTSQ